MLELKQLNDIENKACLQIKQLDKFKIIFAFCNDKNEFLKIENTENVIRKKLIENLLILLENDYKTETVKKFIELFNKELSE